MGRDQPLSPFDLDGRCALVTGGAGLYGRQIVEALASAGAVTLIASRNLPQSEAVAAEYRSRGMKVHARELDQAREASVIALRDEVARDFGRVDVLVNNAVARPMADWSDPVETWQKSMEVNATGVFLMTRTFGEHMAKQGGGSIINIGSIQGLVGPDFTLYEGMEWSCAPDYFFVKGGMNQLSRFAASKLGPKGVRVNTICPGGYYSGQDDAFVQRYSERTFLKRMANDSDLRGIIVFLASDASAYITGTQIPVDGGYTAK